MMRSRRGWLVAAGLLALAACSDKEDDDVPLVPGGSIDGGLDAMVPASDGGIDGGQARLGFFVTSAKSATGNLGGLAGADTRCQTAAAAVGAGNRTWRAFLSVERDATRGGVPTQAGDRIGAGPWYNAKGALLAANLTELFRLTGNPQLFLDERGNAVNGQWNFSMGPDNEHDILTGTLLDGGVALGKTCGDWTSSSDAGTAWVGHSDGLGPMQNATPPLNSWYSVHENGGCHDTTPRGGAGRIYCFAAD